MMRYLTKRGALLRWIALLATLALVLAACAPQVVEEPPPTPAPEPEPVPEPEPAPEPEPPVEPTGEIRFLVAEPFWADWTPFANTALIQHRIDRHIYDTLIDFPTGDLLSEPEPMLATAWRQIDDRTWEFDLREGVVFHDGSPLTAEDVKASIETASDIGISAFGLHWVLAEVEIVDDLTVQVSTAEPYASLFASLWWFAPIVSASFIAEPGPFPIGTGPFRLVEDEIDVKVMEANPDYWGDPPAIERLTWEFIADAETRLGALLDGSAQVIDRVPPEHLPLLEAEEGVELISVTGIESVNLYVRSDRLPEWVENPDFRRAVQWSFDREPLVEFLLGGNTRVARSYIPLETEFYLPQEPQYRFDPERVAEALEAAGMPDGGPTFQIWAADGFLPRAAAVVEAIAAQMEEAGLNVEVVVTDFDGLIGDVIDGDGAMYHLSWATSGDPHHAAAVYSNVFFWFHGDDEVQRLIDLGRTTVDPAERGQVYADLQARLWEQGWHIPLYNSDFTIAHTSDVEGILVLPNVFRTDFHAARLVGSD